MSTTKNPSRDPVQIFCANFPSHKEFSDFPSKYKKPDVNWTKKVGDDIELCISRYSLEVLNLVTSGKEETDELKQLAKAVLEFYAPSPVEKFCRPDKIAKALIDSELIDGDIGALTREVAASVSKWLERANVESRKLLPAAAGFKGEAGYVMMFGGLRWGPIVTLPESMVPVLIR